MKSFFLFALSFLLLATQFSNARADVLTEDFVYQAEVTDQTSAERWWEVPSPSRVVQICGTTLTVSYLFYAPCVASLATVIPACAALTPACFVAAGSAAGFCGVDVAAMTLVLSQCVTRL